MASINLSNEELSYMAEYYRKEYVATLEKLNHLENILRQLGGTPATPGKKKPDLSVTLEKAQPAAASASTPQTAKRKPGRPIGWRKNGQALAPVAVATAPKKRGPRKRITAGASVPAPAANSAAPKKRGRPVGWKKVASSASASTPAPAKPKGKPGRPVGWRKNPDAAAAKVVKPKGKPGRPVGWRKNPEAAAAKALLPKGKPGRPAKPKAAKKPKGKKGPSSIWPEWIIKKLEKEQRPISYLDFVSDAMKEFKIPLDKEQKTTQNINAHIFRMRKETKQLSSVPIPGLSAKHIVLNTWLDEGGKVREDLVAKLNPSVE